MRYRSTETEKRRSAWVLLDRDGTLNVEQPGWLTSPDQMQLLPGAGHAIAQLNAAGLPVVLITNQSVVGRGLLSLDGLAAIHARLRDLLAATGAHLDGLYACPHSPDDHCTCRKPKIGLVDAAARDLALNPTHAVMVGDAERDLQCAAAAGCSALVLVRTGKGAATETRLPELSTQPTVVVDDLAAAVDWILSTCAS